MVFINAYNTYLIYSVKEDGSLIPVYSTDSLNCGFANLGDRLLLVKCNYRTLDGKKWLCGVKKIEVRLELEKE